MNIQHIIVPQTKLLVQLLPELRSCRDSYQVLPVMGEIGHRNQQMVQAVSLYTYMYIYIHTILYMICMSTSTGTSTSTSISMAIYLSIYRSIDQPTNQPTNQSINQSIYLYIYIIIMQRLFCAKLICIKASVCERCSM